MPTRLYAYSAERQTLTDLWISTAQIRSDLKYTGGYSYRVLAGSHSGGYRSDTPLTGFRTGYFFRHPGLFTSSGDRTAQLFGVRENNTDNTQPWAGLFYRDTDQRMLFRRAGDGASLVEAVDLGPAPSALIATNTWIHVGGWFVVHETNGRILLWINGTLAIDYTGDTRPAYYESGSFADYVTSFNTCTGPGAGVNTYGWNGAYYDDWYIDTVTISDTPEPSPSRRFLKIDPNAAGADAAWTATGAASNYQAVDETPHDSDTTYNKALAADLRDTFNFSDPSIPVDHVPVAVNVYAAAKKLDSEVATQISLHLYDGSTYSDSPDLDLPMDYNFPVWHRFTEMPDTSAFDETNLASLQAGYRSRGTF